MEALGFPVHNLSDEDIEKGIEEIAKLTRTFGITAEEASKRMIRMH